MNKIDKIYRFLLLLLMAVGVSTSCKDAEVESGEFYISGEYLTLNFNACESEEAQLTLDVAVVCSSTWIVSAQQHWIHCDATTDYSFDVTVDTNPTSESRSGTIVVNSMGQNIFISVTQDGYLYLNIDVDEGLTDPNYDPETDNSDDLLTDFEVLENYYLTGEGRSFGVTVVTNAYDPSKVRASVLYDGDESGWVSYTSPSEIVVADGSDEATMKFMFDIADYDNEESAREATISIFYSEVDGAVGAKFSVTQDINPRIYYYGESDLELDYFDTSLTVDIASNYSLFVDIPEDCDWITGYELTSTGYELTIAENVNGEDRTGEDRDVEITFGVTDTDVKEVVKLTQLAKDTYITIENKGIYEVDDVSKSLPYVSDNLSFVVRANVTPALGLDFGGVAAWITQSEPTITIDDDCEGDEKRYTYTLMMEANTSETADRECEISFSNDAISIDKWDDVTLVQQKKQSYVRSYSSYDIFSYHESDGIEVEVRSDDGSLSFDITDANGATISDLWISVNLTASPSYESGEGVYTYIYSISIDENCSINAVERTAVVTFKNSDSSVYDSISISQEAKIPYAEILNKADLESTIYSFTPSNISVSVRSNVDLSASVEGGAADVEYLSKTLYDEVSEIYDYVYTITLPTNMTEEVNYVDVTFSNSFGDYTLTMSLMQEEAPSGAILYVDSSIDVAAAIANLGELDAANMAIYERVVVVGDRALSTTDFTSLMSTFTLTSYIDISQTLTTSIPQSQFLDNTVVKEVSFPSTLTTISNSAFNGSAIERVIVPKSVTSIGTYVFANTSKLTDVELEEGLTLLGLYMFSNSGITTVRIPTTIKTWNSSSVGWSYAFQNTFSLVSVELPEGLTTMGARAFDGSGLVTLSIPSTITDWGVGGPTAITDIVTGEEYSYYSSQAFRGISNNAASEYPTSKLIKIELADGLKSIPAGMFQYVNEEVVMYSYSETPPEVIYPFYTNAGINYSVLYSNRNSCSIYVPTDSETLYEETQGWNEQSVAAISPIP